MLLHKLAQKNLINPPTWIPDNTVYLTVMGSQAYATNQDESDMDIYGVAIPSRTDIFPHEQGIILGFGTQVKPFNTWQQHHVLDIDALGGKGREYDFDIKNIVKYFDICMGCNPNCIDSLFTPENCVIHQTAVGVLIRENRRLFLSKACWASFQGYAMAQWKKIKTKQHDGLEKLQAFEKLHNIPNETTFDEVEDIMQSRREKYTSEAGKLSFKLMDYVYRNLLRKSKPIEFDDNLSQLNWAQINHYHQLYSNMKEGSRRAEKVKIATFDLKFAMHLVRLLSECEQILVECDLDIQKNNEHLKAIRRGEFTEEHIEQWKNEKILQLEKLYLESKIPEKPRETEIKILLLQCLEHHYGSLDKAIHLPDRYETLCRNIKDLIDQAGV